LIVANVIERAGAAGATGIAAGMPGVYTGTTRGAAVPSPSAGSDNCTLIRSMRGFVALAGFTAPVTFASML
jgi:hypothetical protein